jgi:hypothetical protein
MGYLEELKDSKRIPPEGAFTVEEARLASGLSTATVRRKISADAAAGRLETGVFLVDAHYTRYYWEKVRDAKVRKR